MSAKRFFLLLFLMSLVPCCSARAQESPDAPPQGPSAAPLDAAQQASDAKARTLLDQMIKAYGGDKWLTLPGYMITGRTSAFYKGKPTGATGIFTQYHAYPDKDRIEFGKKHDAVDFYLGKEGWEITYKGKSPIPQKDLDDYIRRRDHSVEVAVRQWLKDPGTLLINGGQATVERHLIDRVTLLSSTNDNITLELDAQTHLPVRRTFEWRDPVYQDKNVDAEEFDNYHLVNGIQTPFTITRYHNDDMTNQRFIEQVIYGGPIPAEMFNMDATLQKLGKSKDIKRQKEQPQVQ